jgi:type I restriction enzyme S subunit
VKTSKLFRATLGRYEPLERRESSALIFLSSQANSCSRKIRPKLRKVAHPGFKALCSADIYYLIRLANQNCNLSYLLFYLRCGHFSRIVARLADARSNIPKVNRDELSEQTIPLPPLPLQQNFAALVERAERLRAVQREALRQAEHLFISLLSGAFSD